MSQLSERWIEIEEGIVLYKPRSSEIPKLPKTLLTITTRTGREAALGPEGLGVVLKGKLCLDCHPARVLVFVLTLALKICVSKCLCNKFQLCFILVWAEILFCDKGPGLTSLDVPVG